MLAITVMPTALAEENLETTQNILSNGSFSDQIEDWQTSGNIDYDGADYGELNKSVRFSGAEGGSIGQTISLDTIAEDKIIDSVDGSFKSIGCNNIGNDWCTKTGAINNLDTVDWELKFQDETQLEIINFSFTSDYNDGTITQTFYGELDKEFKTDNTNLEIIVSGADTGDWAGQYGTIIDDLSVVLNLSNVVVAETIETADISQINTSTAIEIEDTVQIGSLDANSITNTISTGVIDINPTEDMKMASLSSPISVISDIRTEEMQNEMADIGVSNEMPKLVDTGAEVPVETGIPENELPDIDVDIEIESMSDPEPETLKEIVDEVPAEIEDIEMEEDLKENENEQQEETPAENDENAGEDAESDISDDSPDEEKEENKENEIKEQPNKTDNKTVKNTKTIKSEKKQGSESQNKGDKKSSVTKTNPEIKSDIVIQELDLPTIISFNKEYFVNTYKDTVDLTQTEMEFYDGRGFNDKDYTENNTRFFGEYSNANSEWDMVSKRDVVKIEQFRR